MTGLESVVDNENSTAAFLYLIALAIRKYVLKLVCFESFINFYLSLECHQVF